MTFEYRALVAELVTHGVSCGKVEPVIKACARLFNVQFVGTSSRVRKKHRKLLTK